MPELKEITYLVTILRKDKDGSLGDDPKVEEKEIAEAEKYAYGLLADCPVMLNFKNVEIETEQADWEYLVDAPENFDCRVSYAVKFKEKETK